MQTFRCKSLLPSICFAKSEHVFVSPISMQILTPPQKSDKRILWERHFDYRPETTTKPIEDTCPDTVKHQLLITEKYCCLLLEGEMKWVIAPNFSRTILFLLYFFQCASSKLSSFDPYLTVMLFHLENGNLIWKTQGEHLIFAQSKATIVAKDNYFLALVSKTCYYDTINKYFTDFNELILKYDIQSGKKTVTPILVKLLFVSTILKHSIFHIL